MAKARQPLSNISYEMDRAKIVDFLEKKLLKPETAQAFYDKFPDDAFANYALAQASLDIDQDGKALRYLERAVQLDRHELVYVEALSNIYRDLNFPERAIPMLEDAAKEWPASAKIAALQGDHSAFSRKPDSAAQHYRRALELSTSSDEKIRIKKALFDVLLNADRKAEAQLVLDEFAEDPAQVLFVAASEVEIGRPDLTSRAAISLENYKDDITNPAESRAQAYLAYGRIAENSKDYDLAFKSWESSRELSRPTYDEQATNTELNEVKDIYTAALFNKTRMFANPSTSPIFVVGMPRSGTTLLERIIGSHPRCIGVGEVGRMEQHHRALLYKQRTPLTRVDLFQEALKGIFRDRGRDYMQFLEFLAGERSEFYVDKMPTQFRAAGYIHLCFPKAKFINCLRHPADTFISTYQNNFDHAYSYGFNQKTFVHFYLHRKKMMEYWRSLLGSQILDVSYEELVSNPEPQVRRILEFLELEWDPAVMSFHEGPAVVRTFSRDQVRSAINTKSVARWRNYEKHLAPLFSALEQAGYSYPETSI